MAKTLLLSTLVLLLAFFTLACARDGERAEGGGAAAPQEQRAEDPAAPRADRPQPGRETTAQPRPPTADYDDHAWAEADRADREDPRASARNWLMFAFIGIVIAAVVAAALFYRRA